MDVENGKVPDKYWNWKKEIKDCFLIGNLLLGLLQVQLCFHVSTIILHFLCFFKYINIKQLFSVFIFSLQKCHSFQFLVFPRQLLTGLNS
jgi:hypothetical protein